MLHLQRNLGENANADVSWCTGVYGGDGSADCVGSVGFSMTATVYHYSDTLAQDLNLTMSEDGGLRQYCSVNRSW
jgi:hypothetical protein